MTAFLTAGAFLAVLSGATAGAPPPPDQPVVTSPGGALSLTVTVDDGRLRYSVRRAGTVLVEPSALGLRLTDGTTLGGDVRITATRTRTSDTTWKPLWGADSTVRDHYRELTVQLRQEGGRFFDLVVRAYDDGVAFRYRVPRQRALPALEIVDEATEIAIAGDPVAWWTPRDLDTDEKMWRSSAYTAMDAGNTPVTFRYGGGTHLSVHEADLTDYAAMTVVPEAGRLRAALVPTPGRTAAVVTGTGRTTPWRALTITPDAGGLIESHLLENLNPPCAICTGDTSWIEPLKYAGIWWLIQHRRATWKAGPWQGATTARAKEYIDFAAAHGIRGLLAEGWNEGWEGDWSDQDFLRAAPRFDLAEVVAYGKSKGVEFVSHNETGSGVANYERQIDAAFALYERLGIHYLKTGYVGKIPGRHHFDQRMVNHYRLVLEKAARHRINVICHECVHGTGETRTYPNALAREAVRGQEWEAFSRGNTPEHTLILPFTRMLSGPMDYTPGIMNIRWDPQKAGRRVHTTLAKQLAYYVTYSSGAQMAADLPRHYENSPGLKFLEDVPVTWDETRVLSAEVGDHLVMARRSGTDWYVGAMTGERPRTLRYPLSFLGEGTWVAESYSDGPETDYARNPEAVDVARTVVTRTGTFTAALVRSGGQAVRFRPATPADLQHPSPTPPPAQRG
ncbi:glycoside hydrolase family 97 protein [Actinomadura livida]|uniref:Alpha-glucosidase n=1 Tax=Actinomadura livida TaxID=79909 RepID=A0A7W7I893_9ACTN|nr:MULTISPECIES: glycoside hydrolase family 97 protein [Actinomadura]MBB4772275.1 alpha-glucosidase [Actinomadura catellatispora]GGU28146.1 alpha-glucosidase [Actinomadura livida]